MTNIIQKTAADDLHITKTPDDDLHNTNTADDDLHITKKHQMLLSVYGRTDQTNTMYSPALD